MCVQPAVDRPCGYSEQSGQYELCDSCFCTIIATLLRNQSAYWVGKDFIETEMVPRLYLPAKRKGYHLAALQRLVTAVFQTLSDKQCGLIVCRGDEFYFDYGAGAGAAEAPPGQATAESVRSWFGRRGLDVSSWNKRAQGLMATTNKAGGDIGDNNSVNMGAKTATTPVASDLSGRISSSSSSSTGIIPPRSSSDIGSDTSTLFAAEPEDPFSLPGLAVPGAWRDSFSSAPAQRPTDTSGPLVAGPVPTASSDSFPSPTRGEADGGGGAYRGGNVSRVSEAVKRLESAHRPQMARRKQHEERKGESQAFSSPTWPSEDEKNDGSPLWWPRRAKDGRPGSSSSKGFFGSRLGDSTSLGGDPPPPPTSSSTMPAEQQTHRRQQHGAPLQSGRKNYDGDDNTQMTATNSTITAGIMSRAQSTDAGGGRSTIAPADEIRRRLEQQRAVGQGKGQGQGRGRGQEQKGQASGGGGGGGRVAQSQEILRRLGQNNNLGKK